MIQFLMKPMLPKCGLDEIDQAKRPDSMNNTSYLCSLLDNRPERRLSTHNHYNKNKAFKTSPNSNSIQLTTRILIISIVSCMIVIVATSTIVERPSNGKATIVPGQPLHFECKMVGNKDADYIWYYRKPNDDHNETLLEPNNDELIEIHNTRLTLHKPTGQSAGDYICRALGSDKSVNASEFAVIRARMQPYIEEFNIQTSHTGKSAVVTDGDRLELVCTVSDTTFPVNITWLRSTTPDDERGMVPLVEFDPNSVNSFKRGRILPLVSNAQIDPYDAPSTYKAPGDIIVEAISPNSKRLVIESVKLEHRSYYACVAENGVSSSQKTIFIRVKDRMVALWPFLGIVAELFILFTIIYVWETQRAYKSMQSSGSGNSKASPSPTASSNKRPASGATVAMESVPLTSS